jgi:hypothetical protein
MSLHDVESMKHESMKAAVCRLEYSTLFWAEYDGSWMCAQQHWMELLSHAPPVLFCAYLPPPLSNPTIPNIQRVLQDTLYMDYLPSFRCINFILAYQAVLAKFFLHTCATVLTQLSKIGRLFYDLELFG